MTKVGFRFKFTFNVNVNVNVNVAWLDRPRAAATRGFARLRHTKPSRM